jgi:MoxR-like ATPase
VQRGKAFRLPREGKTITPQGERLRTAVNAAIHLRRPLLVSGDPGTGKTSLAYAIAWELNLGPVLCWSISPRSQLQEDGLFQYDAIARLQDSQIYKDKDHIFPVADYIRLGPVGTAFLPWNRPRVQGRLKVCHGSAGAAMLVPVLSGLLSSFGRPRCHC